MTVKFKYDYALLT